MKFSLIPFIAFLTILKSSFSLKFLFDIEPYTNKCVGEYLIENTLVLFSVTSENQSKVVKFYDPNGVVIYVKSNEDKMKAAYTSKESGNHQICIHNTSKAVDRNELEILTGVAAQDYSSIAKQSNLKPMELNVSSVLVKS